MSPSVQVRRASRLLALGGVVAHATEAVIGLAADAFNQDAVGRVRRLKRRTRAKPFLVVAASLEQLLPLVSLDGPLRREILASWPGPHTWVLPAQARAPAWLRSSTGHIAVRITAHPQMTWLCRAVGPLVSTSANPAGRRPASTILAARRYFLASVDAYLAGATGGSARPSTIRDGISGRILRA